MKPSELLTETQKKNFYETVETVWDDGRERLFCRGHLLIIDKLFPSYGLVGLDGKENGAHPRLQVMTSTEDYGQLHLRRVAMILMRLEESLPCMKGFDVKMLKKDYDFLPQHLEYDDEGADLIEPDKTFLEIIHRMFAFKKEVCPNAYIQHLLMGHIEKRARIFAEKLSTPKKEHYIPKSPPALPSSSTGGPS